MIRKFVLFITAALFIALMVMLGTGFSAINERWIGLGEEQSTELDLGTFEVARVEMQTEEILNEKLVNREFSPKVLRPGEVKVKLSHDPRIGESVKLSLMARNVFDDRKIPIHAWAEFWQSDLADKTGDNQQKFRQPGDGVDTGLLIWEGTLSDIPMEFDIMTQFVTSGIWRLRGYIMADEWSTPIASEMVEFTVTE